MRLSRIVGDENFVIVSVMPAADRLCGLVVRVSGYRYRGPGFDPGATRISD